MTLQTLLLSGTPGTGKTTIAKFLNVMFSWQYISLTDYVKTNNLYTEYDEERDTLVVDTEPFQESISKYLDEKDGIMVIDGHYSDLVEHESVRMAVVIRCNPIILEKRLQGRKYHENKVKENLHSELIATCISYFLEREEDLGEKLEVLEIDSSKLSIEELGYLVKSLFLKEIPSKKYEIGKISWLSDYKDDFARFL